MVRAFFESIATLVGTTIGAGILALPYAVSKTGLKTSIIAMIAVAVITLIINLNYAKVVAKKKEVHQITGYTKKYFGRKAELFMVVINTLFIYGAMTAYLFGISRIIVKFFPMDQRIIGVMALIIIMTIIYLGLKAFEESELLMGIIITALFIIIAVSGFFMGKAPSIQEQAPNWSIFGLLIFAFMGLHAIPEMWEENPDRKSFLKAIKISSVIIFLLYILFTLGVLFLTGSNTEEVATTGIYKVSLPLGVIANMLALLCILTSYLSLAFCNKDMWLFDFKMGEKTAVLLACLPPLIPFLLNAAGFDKILAITGMVFGGIINLVVIAIIIKARKTSV